MCVCVVIMELYTSIVWTEEGIWIADTFERVGEMTKNGWCNMRHISSHRKGNPVKWHYDEEFIYKGRYKLSILKDRHCIKINMGGDWYYSFPRTELHRYATAPRDAEVLENIFTGASGAEQGGVV